MDQHPLTVPADGDRDRLHRREAVGRPVARVDVDVAAPEAVRTMIAMGGAGRVGRDVEPAMIAAECGRAFQGNGNSEMERERRRRTSRTPGPGHSKTVL